MSKSDDSIAYRDEVRSQREGFVSNSNSANSLCSYLSEEGASVSNASIVYREVRSHLEGVSDNSDEPLVNLDDLSYREELLSKSALSPKILEEILDSRL